MAGCVARFRLLLPHWRRPTQEMIGPRGGRSGTRGHKHRRPSRYVDIPTSTPPTCPFVVPGPPPFLEGSAYTTNYALRPNMFPHIRYQFQPHETAMNNSIAQDPIIPQKPSNTQSVPQSVVPRTESSSSQVTSQASNISELYVEPEGDGGAIGGILKIIMPLERILRKNGAARLKDVLSDACEKSTKPQWMSEEVWKGLCNYWDTLEFKAKVERNKRNRASNCGGRGSSLHTCGSIPFTEAPRRLVMASLSKDVESSPIEIDSAAE